MSKLKKPSDREQFSLNIDRNITEKLVGMASEKGIPLNTFINIILNKAIQKYQ